jgi:hypothetical protein
MGLRHEMLDVVELQLRRRIQRTRLAIVLPGLQITPISTERMH